MSDILNQAPTSRTYIGFDICATAANLMLFKLFTLYPGRYFHTFKSGTPTAALFSGIFAVVLIFAFSKLFEKAKLSTVFDRISPAVKNTLMFLLSLIFLLYLAFSISSTLWNFSSLATRLAFPTTPLWAIALLFAIGGLAGIFLRSDSLLRLHGIFVPVLLFGILFLILSAVFGGDITNLFPPLGDGMQGVLMGGGTGLFFYLDFFLVFFLLPDKPNRAYITSTLLRSVLIAAFLSCGFFLTLALTVPASLIGNEFAIFLLSKEIYLGRFLQRTDAIVLLVASISGLLHLSLCFFLFFKTVLGIVSSMATKRRDAA